MTVEFKPCMMHIKNEWTSESKQLFFAISSQLFAALIFVNDACFNNSCHIKYSFSTFEMLTRISMLCLPFLSVNSTCYRIWPTKCFFLGWGLGVVVRRGAFCATFSLLPLIIIVEMYTGFSYTHIYIFYIVLTSFYMSRNDLETEISDMF